MVNAENKIEIKKDGNSFVKDVFVEIWRGPLSNRDYIIGEKYHSPTANGPWSFSTKWMLTIY